MTKLDRPSLLYSTLLGALLVLPAPGSPLMAQTPAPPVFGAQVERVYLDAFVTDRGRPVSGLAASDFELKDDGVSRPVELVALDSLPLTAVLAFDTSGSVAGVKLAALRSAAEAFLEGLRPGDQVALLTFSAELQWAVGPTRDRAVMRKALQGLRAGGATAAMDALYTALTLPPTPARTLVVLFSDGEDNQSWLDERQVRSVAERSNALVYAVGVRPPSSPAPGWAPPADLPEPEHIRALRQIAELTGGRFLEAESPGRLRDAFAAIAAAMSMRYVLGFEPADQRPGWHRLKLGLRRGRGSVQARHGYWLGGR